MTRKMTKMKFAKTDTRYWETEGRFPDPSLAHLLVPDPAREPAHDHRSRHGEPRTGSVRGQTTLRRAQGEWLGRDAAAPPGRCAEKKSDVTIGEYLEAVREKSLLRPATTESYAVALRMIAGAITGRESKAHRDAIKLRSITDDKVEAWRAAYIKRKAVNPLAEKSARITASSLILRAKALFFADTVARIRDVVEIPDPVPFASVKAESVMPPRYRSTFDIVALVESAKEELATERPELFKIFLLGAMAGLRRHEIDLLQWRAFLFGEGAIRIETTEHFRPKSASSEGDIHVDSELLDVFRGFRARAKSDSDFVIESERRRYRCCGRLLRPLPLPPRVRRALQVASLPRRHLQQAAPHAAQGIRKPDPRPLRAARRERGAAPRRRVRDRAALHREQAALGLRLRTSPEERRADRRPWLDDFEANKFERFG